MRKEKINKKKIEKKYNKKGQLRLESTYHGKVKHGIEKKYRNGALYTETPYIQGFKFGVQNEYTSEGILCRQTEYINDDIESIKVYDADGVVLTEETFSRGVKEVTYEFIEECGKIESIYINGHHDRERQYMDDSVVHEWYRLPNGKAGLKRSYDNKNRIFSESINDGYECIEIRKQYSGDKLSSEIAYKDYLQHGKEKIYFSTDSYRESNYYMGKKHGMEKSYFRISNDCLIHCETMYIRGSRQDLTKYYVNGALSNLPVNSLYELRNSLLEQSLFC